MLTSFFSLFIFLTATHAQTLPRPPAKDRVQAIGNLDYFTSNANYKAEGGTYKGLPNSGSYSNILAKLGGSYDMDNQWRLLGGLAVASAESYDGTTTRTGTELTEINAGAQYWMMKQPVWFIPEVKFSYPLQRVSDTTQDIITSEGAMTLQGGAWVGKKFAGLRGLGYLGFKYQDEGRATLLPWVLAIEYRPNFWYANTGARGFETLMKSPDQRADHEVVTSRVNGGSLKYYAVDPSVIEGFTEVGLHHKAWQAWLGLAQTINGSEYAHGLTATIGGLFSWDWGYNGDADYEDTYTPEEPQKENFDMERESYDEKLFRESSPVKPEDEFEEPARPAKKKTVRKKARKKGPSTDKMLDDVEKKLEQGL